MNINAAYCKKCKHFQTQPTSHICAMYCHVHPRIHIGWIIYEDFSSSFKSCFFPETYPPQECPYSLEHAVSTEEEKQQALDSLQSVFLLKNSASTCFTKNDSNLPPDQRII